MGGLKIIKKPIISFVVLFGVLRGFTLADTIYLLDKNVENIKVENINSSGVVLSDSKRISIEKIKKIEFDSFTIPAKPSGIILNDGSILNGIIRGMDEKISFRSTSFGVLEFDKKNIAGIYYDPSGLTELDEKSEGHIIDKNKKVYSGKIVWFDMKSAGILTADGLKKVDNNTIALIQTRPVKPGNKVVLRNGDILNSINSYNKDLLIIDLSEKKASITLKAIKEINFIEESASLLKKR